MNSTSINARIAFARHCLSGIQYASPGVAAELRRAAREALHNLGDAASPNELDPSRSQAQAIAAAMLQALN